MLGLEGIGRLGASLLGAGTALGVWAGWRPKRKTGVKPTIDPRRTVMLQSKCHGVENKHEFCFNECQYELHMNGWCDEEFGFCMCEYDIEPTDF